jgi:hypothetical protein
VIRELVILLACVIPLIFIAEANAKRRGPVPISRDAAIRVRSEVGHATKVPPDLIAASDGIRELEAVGQGSHPEIIDYFTDLLFVEEPAKESILVTVRDLVIEFGPQLDRSVRDQ